MLLAFLIYGSFAFPSPLVSGYPYPEEGFFKFWLWQLLHNRTRYGGRRKFAETVLLHHAVVDWTVSRVKLKVTKSVQARLYAFSRYIDRHECDEDSRFVKHPFYSNKIQTIHTGIIIQLQVHSAYNTTEFTWFTLNKQTNKQKKRIN